MNKAKHAYGSRKNLSAAIEAGTVNAYDILFLNGEDETPAIGWVDKNGNPVIVETDSVVAEDDVIVVESLPETGEEGKIYIFNNEAYLWNGAEFAKVARADLTALEGQVAELGTQMETKVDAETVQTMIDESNASLIEVVEF